MPDFENVFRKLEIDLEEDQQKKEIIRARHAGEDRARWQIVWLVLALTAAFAAASALFRLFYG